MTLEAFFPGVVALLIGLVAPLLWIPILRRIGVVDVPNERSSHRTITLRGGGLAPLTAWVSSILVAIVLSDRADAVLMMILAVSVLTSLIGLVDDLHSISATPRLLGQIVIGVAGGIAVCGFTGVSGWWAVVITAVVVGFINCANFMDGIDWISSLHGTLFGGAFAVAGSLAGVPWLITVGLAIAGAFLAFLPWNVFGAGMFLGDVGSYLLGAVVAITGGVAVASGVSPLLIVPPVAIYLADPIEAVVRRFFRGDGVLTPHRTHVYQRLTGVGFSHLGSALLVAAFTVANSSVGLLWHVFSLPVLLGWLLVLVLVGCYLGLPRMLRAELPPSSNRPLVPVEVTSAPGPRAGFSPQRWVVIGGSGFVGGGVVRHLQKAGFEVMSLPAPRLRLSPGEQDGREVARRAREEPAIASLVGQLRGADVVVNAAGLASPDDEAGLELYGANALLPAVISYASQKAGVARFIHLSSAAVQGRKRHVDATARVAPFSAYSRSKALGEFALFATTCNETDSGVLDLIVLRATSVQGRGRSTTSKLRKIARSRFASVAAPGTQPSTVSSIDGLAFTVVQLGIMTEPVPPIALQLWEGLSVSDVLEIAGAGRKPAVLPRWLCSAVLFSGYTVARVVPRLSGITRRVEMMWFGQAQAPASRPMLSRVDPAWIRAAFVGEE